MSTSDANVNDSKIWIKSVVVTFGLNVRLDLSRKATTKSLSSLGAQPGFEILGESAGTMAVRMIRGVSRAWEISQAYVVVQESLRSSVQ